MPRRKNDGLPPRVYVRDGSYYLVESLRECYTNGKPKQKWHRLTRVDEGKAPMYKALAELNGESIENEPTFPAMMKKWLTVCLYGLSPNEQKETERKAGILMTAFAEFDITDVQPRHVQQFLHDNFLAAGKLPMARSYKGALSKFFRWAQLNNYRTENPCDPIRLKQPPKRDRYITDEEFNAIRTALLTGRDGNKTPSGEMVQCFIDLCYLTGQRSTEIRLMKWNQVDHEFIHFKPTKTAASTGAKVNIPVTPAIAEVLERARKIGKVKGVFVIHQLNGSKYTDDGIRSAWDRACERVGVKNATIKDLRGKHATDALKSGYSIEQIQTSLAHGDTDTTRIYLKQIAAGESVIALELPKPQEK